VPLLLQARRQTVTVTVSVVGVYGFVLVSCAYNVTRWEDTVPPLASSGNGHAAQLGGYARSGLAIGVPG
jgi:hypothetical protein